MNQNLALYPKPSEQELASLLHQNPPLKGYPTFHQDPQQGTHSAQTIFPHPQYFPPTQNFQAGIPQHGLSPQQMLAMNQRALIGNDHESQLPISRDLAEVHALYLVEEKLRKFGPLKCFLYLETIIWIGIYISILGDWILFDESGMSVLLTSSGLMIAGCILSIIALSDHNAKVQFVGFVSFLIGNTIAIPAEMYFLGVLWLFISVNQALGNNMTVYVVMLYILIIQVILGIVLLVYSWRAWKLLKGRKTLRKRLNMSE